MSANSRRGEGRPLSLWLGLLGEPKARAPRRLLAWSGIRGGQGRVTRSELSDKR